MIFFANGYKQTFRLRLYIPSLPEIAGSLQCKDCSVALVSFDKLPDSKKMSAYLKMLETNNEKIFHFALQLYTLRSSFLWHLRLHNIHAICMENLMRCLSRQRFFNLSLLSKFFRAKTQPFFIRVAYFSLQKRVSFHSNGIFHSKKFSTVVYNETPRPIWTQSRRFKNRQKALQ